MGNYLRAVDPLAYARDEWPPELFVEWGLPAYAVPHVHAGLPRKEGLIKANFNRRETIFRHYIDRAFLSHYAGLPFPCHKPVVLFTWVMNDGLGDWGAQIAMAGEMRRAFPRLPIQLITLVDEKVKYHLQAPGVTNHLLFYRGFEKVLFPPHLLELMAKSALIIQAPTYYPHFKEVMEKVEALRPPGSKRPRELLIGEYGFLDSEWFHPESKARCMGLHALEKGLLFSPSTASQTKAEKFYFAYLTTLRGHTIYLHALCSYLKEDSADITLYLCHLPHLLEALQGADLARYGVREVVIETRLERSHLPLQEEGKRLIIRQVITDKPEEISLLMKESEDFVGCRGDRSFSEVVASGCLFFYDAPDHALPFLDDLYLLARDRLSGYPLLLDYLEKMRDRKSSPALLGEEIGRLLKEPSLHAGAKRLAALLFSDYSFNQNLVNLITCEMLSYYFPLMMQKESELLQQFCLEKIDFQKLVKRAALSPSF